MATKLFDTEIKVFWDETTDDGTPIQTGAKLEEIVAKLNNNKAEKTSLTTVSDKVATKANKASIISEINSSEETEVISADKLETMSTCATGSFVNDSTSAVKCQTNFSAKPSVFRLYYIADSTRTLAAEFFPNLDTDLQKFIYNDVPLTAMGASANGLVNLKFSSATGMTFIWEAYR